MTAKGTRQPKYDWPAIRAAYVEGTEIDGAFTHTPTLEQIAAKFGPNPANLRVRASTEQWTTQRNIFTSKVDQSRREQRATILASRGAEFDTRFLEISEKMLGMAENEVEEKIKQIRRDKSLGATVPSMLRELANSLEKVQKMGRLALGDTTEEQGSRGQEPPVKFTIVGGGSLSPESNEGA